MQQGSVGSGKFLERFLCFSEGGCADATVLGVIRQLLSVWCGPDGCYMASNLINGVVTNVKGTGKQRHA
jgi:hypothetical protein